MSRHPPLRRVLVGTKRRASALQPSVCLQPTRAWPRRLRYLLPTQNARGRHRDLTLALAGRVGRFMFSPCSWFEVGLMPGCQIFFSILSTTAVHGNLNQTCEGGRECAVSCRGRKPRLALSRVVRLTSSPHKRYSHQSCRIGVRLGRFSLRVQNSQELILPCSQARFHYQSTATLSPSTCLC